VPLLKLGLTRIGTLPGEKIRVNKKDMETIDRKKRKKRGRQKRNKTR